jgi:hypothetical protein
MKVKIFGGLGNQLFKFMAAAKFNQEVSQSRKIGLNLSWYQESSGKSRSYVRNFDLFQFPNIRKSCYEHVSVSPLIDQLEMRVPNLGRSVQYMLGYLTDKNYSNNERRLHFHTMIGDFENFALLPNKSLIAELLKFPKMQSSESLRLSLVLESRAHDVVAVHVRRGDYLSFQNTYPILDTEYYVAAKKRIEAQLNNPSYWLFSDDPQMAFNDLKGDFKFSEIISEESNCSTVETLELMSKCNGLITANSTFSWWGAYIATIKNDSTAVVVPRHYKHYEISDTYSPSLHVPGWTIQDN